MKWSFTGGLENNLLTGFNLCVGSKRETTKKRLLTQQNMHNLQRKFDVLHHFVCLSHKSWTVFLLLPPASYNKQKKRSSRLTQILQLKKNQNKSLQSKLSANSFVYSCCSCCSYKLFHRNCTYNSASGKLMNLFGPNIQRGL